MLSPVDDVQRKLASIRVFDRDPMVRRAARRRQRASEIRARWFKAMSQETCWTLLRQAAKGAP